MSGKAEQGTALNRGRISRRRMLQTTSTGFGMLAATALLADEAGAANPQSARAPHFTPQVKNVIFCYMSGGMSQVDSFDPKPKLAQMAGEPVPFKAERTMFNNNGNIFPSPWEFKRRGESGIPVSGMFPHIGEMADELCVIRSMTGKFMEHAQGNYHFHCGLPFAGFPSMGSWVTYGLGTENENLPGFVVTGGGGIPHGGINMMGNGFLPSVHQASLIHPGRNEPLRNITPSATDSRQRRQLDFVRRMDRSFLADIGSHEPVEAAIANYETAYRMQSAVPELVDLGSESKATRKLYGLDSDNPSTAAYAKQCLLARRLVERGVRFVELTMVNTPGKTDGMGNPWDQHDKLELGHGANALTVDQPVSGLLKDLKALGLLDETLVLFSGEFGRTPFAQGTIGRDHNPFGFSLWLAGGGLKKGFIYGQTDEFGYRVVENLCSVHDLHATVLHLLGLDHEKLSYRFGGRDYTLTDVHGHVLRGILA
jgi:hypothetical protein